MSGDTVGTAMDALFLLGGGLGFARLGLGGLRSRPAVEATPGQEAAAPPQPGSSRWQIFSALMLVFGGIVALCGLLLALSMVFPGRAQ